MSIPRRIVFTESARPGELVRIAADFLLPFCGMLSVLMSSVHQTVIHTNLQKGRLVRPVVKLGGLVRDVSIDFRRAGTSFIDSRRQSVILRAAMNIIFQLFCTGRFGGFYHLEYSDAQPSTIPTLTPAPGEAAAEPAFTGQTRVFLPWRNTRN